MMMRKSLAILVLIYALLSVKAGATTVTGTVTDSDGISWANGSITFTLTGNAGQGYQCAGAPMTPSQTLVTASLDSTGSFSTTICDNSTITPVNSQWAIQVNSAATAPPQTITPTTVSGSSQSLTSYINGLIKAIRIPVAFGTRAYGDVEIVSPPSGATYFSLITLTNRNWNGTSWGPVGAFSAPSLFAFGGFGDSYVLGIGATNSTVGGGFSQLSRTIVNVPATNFGVSGANTDSINFNVWTEAQASPQQTSAYLFNSGSNDDHNCGITAPCLANFKEEANSSIARLAIPNQERVFGSSCTQTSGTWTADTTAYPIPAPLYFLNSGTAVSASASGAILTCTIASRSTSSQVGLNFQVTNAQTGTFTVSVDGVQQIDSCSGTTTFTSAPCGANLLTLPTVVFRQEFIGIAGTSHTVVVTTTNAAKVNVTAIDAITSLPQPNSNYVVVLGPNAAFDTNNTYNTLLASITNQFKLDGALVTFANQQAGTPGVNNTTDTATTATANCTASTQSGHPNDICGYFHLAQTVVNATLAQGWNIFGMPQSFNTSSNNPIVVTGNSTTQLFWADADSSTIPGYRLGTGANATVFDDAAGGRIAWGYNSIFGNAFFGGVGTGRGVDFYAGGTSVLNGGRVGGFTPSGVPWHLIGTAIASATTIAPTGAGIFHITGITAISTITPPANCTSTANTCELRFIPDALGSTVTGGNIAISTTFVVDRLLIMTYDAAQSKWYPSY